MITERQKEVLRALMDGLSLREAAGRLGLSEQTVKNHTHSAYKRLGVRNKVSAFRALGWIQ